MAGNFQFRFQEILSKLLKYFLEFKNIIMEKKNSPINTKMVMNFFSHVRFPCNSLNLMVLAYIQAKQEVPEPWEPYAHAYF
jgi:hypothetical protein